MKKLENVNDSGIKNAYKVLLVTGLLGFSAIAVNISIIYLSIKTNDGLVEENYYTRGVNYQNVIDAQAVQEKLGWQIKLMNITPHAIARKQSGDQPKTAPFFSEEYKKIHKVFFTSKVNDTYTVSAFDKIGQPLKNVSVKLSFFRPTQNGFDKDFALSPTTPGVYQSKVTLPLDGIWDVYINVRQGGLKWTKKERIKVIK